MPNLKIWTPTWLNLMNGIAATKASTPTFIRCLISVILQIKYMHELSICQSLLDQVEKLAYQHQAYQVASIKVQLGPLSGVVPELLDHAFQIARADTLAASAELILEILPIRVHCQTCGADSEATPNQLICGICGDWHTQLLSGNEMLLASVELLTE